MTLWVSGIAGCLAIAIGLWMAFARSSKNPWLRLPASAYVELFRNTPLLIQLYFFYRGLQSVGLILSPELCGILALSLYTGAYMTDIFRAGFSSVPQQQLDAGLSLGFSRLQTFRLILLPQALPLILPPLGNQLINLTKNSSLLAFITVEELFHVIYNGAVEAFRPMEYFLVGSALYITIALGISSLIHLFESLFQQNKHHTAQTCWKLRHG